MENIERFKPFIAQEEEKSQGLLGFIKNIFVRNISEHC